MNTEIIAGKLRELGYQEASEKEIKHILHEKPQLITLFNFITDIHNIVPQS